MNKKVCVCCDEREGDGEVDITLRDMSVYDGMGSVIGTAHLPVCDACYVGYPCLVENDQGHYEPFTQNPK